jgi:hypothetical protein
VGNRCGRCCRNAQQRWDGPRAPRCPETRWGRRGHAPTRGALWRGRGGGTWTGGPWRPPPRWTSGAWGPCAAATKTTATDRGAGRTPLAATLAATRALFLGPGRVAGAGVGQACSAPGPGWPWASSCRVTDRLGVGGARSAAELDRPAGCTRAAGAGPVAEARRERRGDVLAWRGRPSRLGGVRESGQAREARRLEPGAQGGLVAVEPPGKLRATPARRRPEHVVPALGAVWPGTTGRCSQGVCRRGQAKPPPGDSSPAGEEA